MWYIWAAPNSPLFGKSKMSTFERYFIEDPSTHEEKKNAYYRLWENEEVVDNMLREFGLDPEKGAYHQWSCSGTSERRREPCKM